MHRTQRTQNRLSKWRLLAAKTAKSCGDLEKCLFPDANVVLQGGHKPGKHGKPRKRREFEKLSKSQGKLREILYFVEKPGKLRENVKYVTQSSMEVYENVFHRSFLSRVSQGKV